VSRREKFNGSVLKGKRGMGEVEQGLSGQQRLCAGVVRLRNVFDQRLKMRRDKLVQAMRDGRLWESFLFP